MDELENGEGKIVDYKGKKIAAYKDENGKVFTVSEKCTYEGCNIYWIQERKIWKCSCCGSEYSVDGKVIKGPATESLKKINI